MQRVEGLWFCGFRIQGVQMSQVAEEGFLQRRAMVLVDEKLCTGVLS